MTDHLGKRLKRWRCLTFCLIALTATVIVGSDLASRFKFFVGVEEKTLDLRFDMRGAEDPEEDAAPIVIVKIDDRSLYPELSESDLQKNPAARFLAETWPWNRAAHGRLLQRLIDAGAQIVAFDLVFPGPNEGDFDFLDAIEANPGQVVLGYDYLVNESAMGETFVGERLPYDDLLPVEFSDLLGFVNVPRDDDGAIRQAKLTTNIFYEKLPFTYDPDTRARLQKAAQMAETQYSLAARTALNIAPQIAPRIPATGEQPHINYGATDYFPTVSYIDVLLDDRFQKQAALFEDAIVFVGAYSDFFKDVVSSPVGDIYGVDAHAHAARSLLNNSFYHEIGRQQQWLLLALVAALLLLGALNFRGAPIKGAFLFLFFISYLVVSQVAFTHGHTILPVIPAVCIILFPGTLFLLYDFTITQYERRRLQGYLGRYVSREIADLIAQDSGKLDAILRGANRPIVTLFADIRGFTSLSERVTPEQLIAQLNEYFEVMIARIQKRRGSLNKYIGDAILAVWGDIHSEGSAQDCENAVCTALEMGEALEALNRHWAEQPEREPIAIGVGISFGNGFVGNMGHPDRMEFAVMGDVVNLASRLEGATKLYDGTILVNQDLVEQCGDRIRFQEIDRLQVKGKTRGIAVYRPLGAVTEPAPDWLPDWERARALYLKQAFAEAAEAFEAIAARYPEQSKNAALYRERCQIFQKQPPGSNWDGTFVMQTK